jgi:predicted  nucleic acid-binding Zn-ribbon protein
LNSRKKLETQNPKKLQLLEVAAAAGGPTYLKVSRKEKAKEGVDKAIKPGGVEKVIKTTERSQPPPRPQKKKRVGSTSIVPAEKVPASITVTPEDTSGTVRSRVLNTASKLLLESKLDTVQDKDLFPGDGDESTITTTSRSMSQITTPSATISVADHKSIVDGTIKRHDEIKAKEMKQKDAAIASLKRLTDDLKNELEKAQDGKESSADPVLKMNLMNAQQALAKLSEEKKQSDQAYTNLQNREKQRKKKLKELEDKVDELEGALNGFAPDQASGGNTNPEISTLKSTVADLQKQLDDARNSSGSPGNGDIATLKATVEDLTKQLDAAKKSPQKELQKRDSEIASLKSQLKGVQGALSKSKNEMKTTKAQLKKAQDDLKRALASDSSQRSTRSGGSTSVTVKALQEKVKKGKQELLNMTSANRSLVATNNKLTKKLEEAYKELKKQGKSTKAEQNEGILKAARQYLKDIVFRTVKLVSSKKPAEVESFMRKVYYGIKSELGLEDEKSDDSLDFEDFNRIYQSDLLSYFSTQRSNVQQACLKAVIGTYFTQCFV